MKKQNLQKGELDQIGRELLEAARISNDEIEQIIAAPQLFDAVKSRIKTEQRERPSKIHSGNWWDSFFWNWQGISAAVAVFAFFICGAFGFVLINKSLQFDEYVVNAPESQTQVEAVEIQEIPEDFPEIAEKKNSEINRQLIAKKQTFKKESTKKPDLERKTPSVKKSPQTEIELAGEFYALNFVGKTNETGEALHIVRTELSPSALFALGVDVPIENAPEKIKTDLLVGSDGVARAIRFVE